MLTQSDKSIAAALALWRETPADQLESVFRERADRVPPDAIDLYLLGCVRLRQDDIPGAARAFGAAYHADCRLESAALLTFACLKASADGASQSKLPIYVEETWHEMKRPPLAGRGRELKLLAELRGAAPSGTISPGELLRCLLQQGSRTPAQAGHHTEERLR